jgi:PAS domain S-box-containing protein
VLPDDTEGASAFLKRVAQRRSAATLDVVMRDADDRQFPVRLQIEPVLKDGRIVGYSGLALDIAAQLERERELTEHARRIEAREQQVHDVLNEAVYILDRQGRLGFVNARMAALLAATPRAAIGCRIGDFMPASSAARIERDFARRLAGEPGQPFEILLRGPEGGSTVLEVRSTLFVRQGATEGVLGVARDITARRRMERELAQATRLSALGRFASGVAHEINNPLGLVSGYAEELQVLLAQGPPGADPDPRWQALRHGLGTIQQQARRCKAITDNLLAFARGPNAETEAFDVGLVLARTLTFFAEVGLTRGIEVAVDIAPGLPQALGSPALLEQVLQNVIKNACDAMGGSGRIDIRAGGDAEGIEIEIGDSGPGLTPEALAHAFDPFFTTKAPGKGTGLGLSICYAIMSEMHGSIGCGNAAGGGAWFRLRLAFADGFVGESDRA